MDYGLIVEWKKILVYWVIMIMTLRGYLFVDVGETLVIIFQCWSLSSWKLKLKFIHVSRETRL